LQQKGDFMAEKNKKRKNGYYQTQKTFTIEGKKITHTFYYKTQKELTEKVAAFRAKQTELAKHYFKAVAEEWQEVHWQEINSNTRTCYTASYNRAIEEFGEVPIADITPLDIQNYIDSLAAKRFSKQTVKIHRIVLTLIFKYAMLHGYVTFNAVEPTRIPRNLKKSKRDIPSDDEIQKVIHGIDEEFGFFAFFLLFTGCRKGEALALQWRDFNMEERTIHISKTIIYSELNQNTPIVQDKTKTESGDRYIHIPNALFDKLRPGKSSYYVFGGKTPLTKSQLRKRWEKYKKATGITFTPHQLRHAYATMLYESDVREKDAQRLMGHSSIQVTKDVYTHISNERAHQTYNQLDEYISTKLLS